VLRREGVPEDMKYIAVIESGFTNVVSPAGATGYLAVHEGDWQKHGLEVNAEVDERYHVEKSTVAACKYLKNAYAKIRQDWALAAAAYNLGPGGVDKQLGRQKTRQLLRPAAARGDLPLRVPDPGHEGDHARTGTVRLPPSREGSVRSLPHPRYHRRSLRSPDLADVRAHRVKGTDYKTC
jgi:hypothetical protein